MKSTSLIELEEVIKKSNRFDKLNKNKELIFWLESNRITDKNRTVTEILGSGLLLNNRNTQMIFAWNKDKYSIMYRY